MALPTGLTQQALREVELDAMRDRPVDLELVRVMAETLSDLLDEAAEADEEHASIDDLLGIIPRLEKLRVDDITEEEKKTEAAETKLEEAGTKHAEAMADLANDAAEWRRRAELAEHEGGGAEWKKRAEKAERELAEGRSNVELALTRRKEAEQEVATLRALHAASAGERARFEADARRLSQVLLGIVDGRPEEAWKKARLALGRDIIEQSGTGGPRPLPERPRGPKLPAPEAPAPEAPKNEPTIPTRSAHRRMIRKEG